MEIEKKSKHSKPHDRLSELPDSLIFSIFEFLPMKYVVRTQILSLRWKNLWTLTPCLHFVNDSENSDDKDVFRNLVNRCLLRWRGTRVQKFKVSDCDYKVSLFRDIDLWLRFAVDNGVEELHISFRGEYYIDEDHFVPQFLYSCSSLRKLYLEAISMDVRGNVEWNKLKSLTIQCFEVTGHAINQILCGSPLLEVLMLYLAETYKNSKLCFRSSSLKELYICKMASVDDDMTNIRINSELEISTPNLETLTISGVPHAKCLLMNVLSLTQATLSCYAVCGFEFVVSATDFDFLGRTLSQIFPTIQHVKRLTLSDWCIKALGDRKSKCLISPLSNVKFLTLRGSFKEHEQIVDFLEIFPKLRTLVVVEEDTTQSDATSKSKLKVKPNSSKLFLEELRTIKVTCVKHDFLIFPLIKSLLKYASNLEKMILRVEETTPPSRPSSNSLFKASQELLRMPRSSNCSVDFR